MNVFLMISPQMNEKILFFGSFSYIQEKDEGKMEKNVNFLFVTFSFKENAPSRFRFIF